MNIVEIIETELSSVPETNRFGVVVTYYKKVGGHSPFMATDVMEVDQLKECFGASVDNFNTIREEVCINRNTVEFISGSKTYTVRKANSYDVAAAFDIDIHTLIENGEFPGLNETFKRGNVEDAFKFRIPFDGIGPRPANYAFFSDLQSDDFNPLNRTVHY